MEMYFSFAGRHYTKKKRFIQKFCFFNIFFFKVRVKIETKKKAESFFLVDCERNRIIT